MWSAVEVLGGQCAELEGIAGGGKFTAALFQLGRALGLYFRNGGFVVLPDTFPLHFLVRLHTTELWVVHTQSMG